MLSTRCAWTFFCPQITLMCTDFFPCPLRGPGGREEVTIYHSPFTIHPPVLASQRIDILHNPRVTMSWMWMMPTRVPLPSHTSTWLMR
jgi:hypothetical protein